MQTIVPGPPLSDSEALCDRERLNLDICFFFNAAFIRKQQQQQQLYTARARKLEDTKCMTLVSQRREVRFLYAILGTWDTMEQAFSNNLKSAHP